MTQVGDFKALQSLSTATPLGPYQALVDWVGKLEESEAIKPLPGTYDARREHSVAHRKTMAKRFWMLGYLPQFPTARHAGQVEHEAFEAAVAKFQCETTDAVTPLVQDGWAGPKTWKALSELVSFEGDFDVGNWCRNHFPCTTLVRAVLLRLRALGFVDADVHTKLCAGTFTSADAVDSLNRFRSTAIELGFMPESTPCLGYLPDDAWSKVISVLFDLDLMTNTLARGFLSEIHPSSLLHADGTARTVICIARIELWLAGCPIRPVGWEPETLVEVIQRLHRALSVIASQFGEMPGRISRQLFERLCGLGFGPGPLAASPRHLLGAIDAEAARDVGFGQKLWERAKLLASRCFDGIERAKRWLTCRISGVIDSIRHTILNLWRTIVSWLTDRMGQISMVCEAVREGICGATEMDIRFEDLPGAALGRKEDYDTLLWVQSGKSAAAHMLVRRHGLRAQCLKYSCNLLREFLEIVGDLVKAAGATSTGVGLFIVAYALYQLWQNIGDLRGEIGQLIAAYTEYQATFAPA